MPKEITGNVKITNNPKTRSGDLDATINVTGNAADLLNRAADNSVSLRRSSTPFTKDVMLWEVIRRTTGNLSFTNYEKFIDQVLCKGGITINQKFLERRALPYNDTDAYRLLKVATEAFLVANCGTYFNVPTNSNDSKETQWDSDHFGSDFFNNLEQRGINDPEGNDLPVDLWRNYLNVVDGVNHGEGILPYLFRIQSKFPELNLEDVINDITGSAVLSDATGSKKGNEKLKICDQLIKQKLQAPCMVELIWSYWHEEAMLVQTMNAISMRFQNVRITEQGNPLAMMEINPLRPLNNLMWGYIQDEQHRLSVLRRVYEYDHHYGLTLYGKAIPQIRPADSRSKFLEAFHNLLYLCTIFFKEADDTTIVPDGFPILNALKEVHLLLSEGAHNQFGDLPTTARIEMLMQQWLLSRPEFREFLPSRASVAYPEPWMGGVDAMKNTMGWTDVSSMHFNKLATFGEQLLLTIRYGNWASIDDPVSASNWAKSWRPQIQGYTYSYRTVTRVDLTADITDGGQTGLRYLPPSVHLQQRLREQQSQQRALPPGQGFPSVVTAQPRLTQSRMRQLRPRN